MCVSQMISIIVPVYNVKEYLGPCIESILNSTYKDYELILVDDGSTDGSGAICDRYAAKDNRIRVIHQSNVGVCTVRNTGLKAVKGQYVMFVDGDDLIHPRMIETLKTAIDIGDYDFAMINGVSLTPEEAASRLVADEHMPIDTASWTVLDQATCINNVVSLDTRGYHFHVVWNKIYKKELIDGLYFKNTAGEDFEWTNRMHLRANRGIDTGAELYYYIQRDGSIMHRPLDPHYIDRINSFCECYYEMPADNRAYRDLALHAVFSFMMLVRERARHTPHRDVAKSCCAQVYKKTRADLWRSGLSFFRKLRYECFYHFPWTYRATVWGYYKLFHS